MSCTQITIAGNKTTLSNPISESHFYNTGDTYGLDGIICDELILTSPIKGIMIRNCRVRSLVIHWADKIEILCSDINIISGDCYSLCLLGTKVTVKNVVALNVVELETNKITRHNLAIITPAVRTIYWDMGFQSLTFLCEHEVRGSRAIQYMFAISHCRPVLTPNYKVRGAIPFRRWVFVRGGLSPYWHVIPLTQIKANYMIHHRVIFHDYPPDD